MKDHDAMGEWCLQNDISLVVIGPEDPLADGMVDALTQKGQCLLQLDNDIIQNGFSLKLVSVISSSRLL